MPDLFDDIWDWVSGGQVTRASEERGRLSSLRSRLETLVKSYSYWHEQGTILSKSLYRITIMAYGEVCRLHDVIEHLTINQRKIIEQSLKNKRYALKNIERSLLAINSVFDSSRQLLNTKQFAKDTLDGNLSILKDIPNGTGLATAGIYTIISGLDHYASLSSQINSLKAAQYEVLQRIDELEGAVLELKAKVHRADEMGAGLGKGISAFRKCHDIFYRKLFPRGEVSKQEREERLASGGKYFLDSENPLIVSIITSAGHLLKMVEAKP